MLTKELVGVPGGVVVLLMAVALHPTATARALPPDAAPPVVADEPDVSSRSAARADAAPTASWRGTCDNRGDGWGTPVDIALQLGTTPHGLEATGELGFVGRHTQATLTEVAPGRLVGHMDEIDGLGTVWQLRLELHGGGIRLYEVYGHGHDEALICAMR